MHAVAISKEGNDVFEKEYIIIVTDLLKAFLGNGPVNTFQCATMEDVSQWMNVMAHC
jgi:hypothetical protein